MIIDHIGAFLFPQYLGFRIIGRIAFPIYTFLIAEGFCHTRDVRKYMLRLGAFALISEIPFDLAATGKALEFTHQNVFFTLFLGVVLLYLYTSQYNKAARIGSIVLLLLAADFLRTDYGAWGVLMIFCFYIFRENMFGKVVSVSLINLVAFGSLQSYAALALLPICLYNGEKGRSMKYFFYIMYPAHLLVLYLIRIIM